MEQEPTSNERLTGLLQANDTVLQKQAMMMDTRLAVLKQALQGEVTARAHHIAESSYASMGAALDSAQRSVFAPLHEHYDNDIAQFTEAHAARRRQIESRFPVN